MRVRVRVVEGELQPSGELVYLIHCPVEAAYEGGLPGTNRAYEYNVWGEFQSRRSS